jgi:PAS domain S-box-containing protein
MCGNVLRGRFDPSKSFFTASGSFWSSCTSELLATTTDADRQAKTRNRCNSEGYESVALIPLRAQGETFGLFQFNDKRKGRFTAGDIAMLESLVTYVAIALAKFKADETLRSSEARYRSLFENMQEGYAYCRMIVEDGDFLDFVHLDVNTAFGKLTGLKDVVGKKVTEVIPGIRENNPELFEIYGRVATTGDPEKFETYVGALKTWFSVSVYSPAKGFFVAMFDNITERRKLEEQLRQAMKIEAVGRLAGGVAHDFNNLLTVITGYSELLLKKIGKESPMHRDVEEIKRAGERAASLTQQLLAFSRKQIIEPKVVRLDLLVADMQAMLTRLIGEDIALQATTGKSLGSVKVDPGQFQQILMNLMVNARDAMPDGGTIGIETANVDLDEGYCAVHPYVIPGRFVMLSVSDTGHGMSEEVKAQIFEPFFTTKERGSGTGLGLATTYGAVHQAGGSIEVYTEVGIGTTFKIYLPRVEEEASPSVKDDRTQDMRGGSETVLLVEDEDIVRNLCVRILERLGYKVMQARNGAEAVALAQGYGDRIDLLLTDVVMPGMNGAELARQLVLHHPEMKILFTSGYTDDAIVRHGILKEGVSFIGKPYTPSALAKKVRGVLDR